MWWLINNKKMWQYPAATVVNLPYPLIYTYDAMDSPPPQPLLHYRVSLKSYQQLFPVTP